MDILTYVYENWKNTEWDDRTKDWFTVKYDWNFYALILVYFYIVLVCGPKYMQNRKPYSLKTFMKFYNIFQIVYNFLLVYFSIRFGMFTDFGLKCVPLDRSPAGKPMSMVYVYYYTLILKIIDLSETVIFVLRKKDRQISYLHLYHHVSTIYISGISVRYYPGGVATFPIIINSSIHVVMYTYYLLSSQGPRVQAIINPFKKYITMLQMIQFFALLAHALQGIMPSCKVPRWGALVMIINLIINCALFYNFYRQNYKLTSKPKKS